MKTCKQCNCKKSLDSFHLHPQCADGRQNTCKECKRQARSSKPIKPAEDIDLQSLIDRIRFVPTRYGLFPISPKPASQRAFSLGAT